MKTTNDYPLKGDNSLLFTIERNLMIFFLQYIFYFSSLKCIYWKDRLIITLKKAYALPHFPRDRHFNKKQKSDYSYKNLFYFFLQHLPKFLVENCRSYLLHLQDIFTIKFGDRKKKANTVVVMVV